MYDRVHYFEMQAIVLFFYYYVYSIVYTLNSMSIFTHHTAVNVHKVWGIGSLRHFISKVPLSQHKCTEKFTCNFQGAICKNYVPKMFDSIMVMVDHNNYTFMHESKEQKVA